MRLGFNGATTLPSDLATDIRIAGLAGYDVIELRDDKLDRFVEHGSLDDVRRMLRDAGVAAYTINSIDRVGAGGDAGTQRAAARCRELSRYAQAIDCPWVLVVPGATEGRSREQVRNDTAAALRELVDVAAEFGVGIAFEFMGFPWSAVRDLASAWEIVQSTGRPGLGLVVDTAHFFAGSSTLDSVSALDPRRLAVLHINDVENVPKDEITDAHRLYPGDGIIPLPGILRALRLIGFDGVVSVELFREEYWQRDPLTVAREARSRTRAVWDATHLDD
jgi:2-keto-myo-inositol isomerase